MSGVMLMVLGYNTKHLIVFYPRRVIAINAGVGDGPAFSTNGAGPVAEVDFHQSC